MIKIFCLIVIFIFISNCTLNKVIKHHGVHFLETKQNKLIVGKSSKNDITELLGPPSTKSTFEDDLWIYMEIQTSSSKLSKLGKKKLLKNNILLLDIDNKGILKNSIFFNKENMNELKFSNDATQMDYSKNSFIYDFLNSLRQKINDPLGKKKIK
ncbi:outer membrane protein assembly factor BamE [Candidatus Pelagibacter sp. Uisw_092]|uniref:outer membrane protein assembly factor BamE domain-containing protein n=1 Tax=Candidatus Pelagibacter sp. Uisw_092 TaxID=3230979 RepID=UPI0039EA5D5B